MKKIKQKIAAIFIVLATVGTFSFQSDFFEVAKQIDIYTTLFKELNMYYVDEVNPAKLTKNAIGNMLQNLDPYTQFYDEQGIEDARIAATGEFGGIGATTRFKNKRLFVYEILKDAPAEKGGLRPGDEIISVNNVAVKDYDEIGAASLLNGLPNTLVQLEINRQNKLLNIELTREKIIGKAVPYFTLLDNEVGYISFIEFNKKASEEVKKAFLELKEAGMKKLVIDVRHNPGGLLNEAVKITNFFIPKDKIVVTTKAKIAQWSDTFKTQNEPLDLEIPIAVLIDNRSASASEILAGALQDYDRAVIIGTRSFGKGLVQRFRELTYGTQMKLTISKYYTPSGRCIQELDYTNRKEDGTIPKFADYGIEKYTTENGRTVYGGGGVLPDVELKKTKTTTVTEELFASDAYFNFVTDYFYKNPVIEPPKNFEPNNLIFKLLILFLEQNKPDFITQTEAAFEAALQLATENNLTGLNQSYAALRNTIQTEKMKQLEQNKDEITNKLAEDIVKRYYYIEGVYQHKTAFDSAILEAKTLLNNSDKYNKIISK